MKTEIYNSFFKKIIKMKYSLRNIHCGIFISKLQRGILGEKYSVYLLQ